MKLFGLLALALLNSVGFAQELTTGELEAQKCEERIASVQRDVLGRYDDALQELQLGMQKAADLEGALAIRAERQRVAKQQALTSNDLVNEPKALRALQTQTLTKMQELVAQLVGDTLPKLVEHKRALTIAGKLDEAVAVRAAIERLQNNHVPLNRPEPGSIVTADVLLQAYAADRARADKTYKGQKITVRGVVGGFRQDPADSKSFLVYLASTSGGWVQCAFGAGEFRFREEQQFNTSSLVIIPKANEAGLARVQKGQPAEIRGVCEGLDEMVRLARCEIAR